MLKCFILPVQFVKIKFLKFSHLPVKMTALSHDIRKRNPSLKLHPQLARSIGVSFPLQLHKNRIILLFTSSFALPLKILQVVSILTISKFNNTLAETNQKKRIILFLV